MSYEKSIEMKIIRTKHLITFYDLTRAIDILNDLKQVPPEAKVIAFKTTEEDNHHMIVFELEEKQKEEV